MNRYLLRFWIASGLYTELRAKRKNGEELSQLKKMYV